jgi:pyrroloquinoline quinone biosynthesis protein D
MNDPQVPRLNRGVRLSRDPDGVPLLLAPEAILRLNDSAAAALELVDGTRSVDEIVDALCTRYRVVREEAARDVGELFDRLVQRGYVSR